MHVRLRGSAIVSAAVAAAVLAVAPGHARAQGRGRGGPPAASEPSASVQAQVTISVGDQATIRDYYASHASGAEALPPGIRKNLARGKPMPPGIAKKMPPPDLRAALHVPDGYEIVEAGLDVLLVDVATNVVHDVLTDIVR